MLHHPRIFRVNICNLFSLVLGTIVDELLRKVANYRYAHIKFSLLIKSVTAEFVEPIKNLVVFVGHLQTDGISFVVEASRVHRADDREHRVIVGNFVGRDKLPGVVCSKPVHLLKADEKGKPPKVSSLTIDIGAESREEAEKYVSIGDSIIFDSFYDRNDSRIISKAIDDRFGCLVLTELIKSELPYDMNFVFCVQEEIGLRGARTAAYTVDPDSAIVIEATTAGDLHGVEGEKRVCLVGKGPVVSFMDRSTIYDKEYYRLAMRLGDEMNIPVQTKTMIAGGNDAGVIHISRGGVRTAAVSVPCRYLHASESLISVSDAENLIALVKALAEKMAAGA